MEPLLIVLKEGDYSFIMKFDPDRDRTATRQDMIDVLHTIQCIVAEGAVW